MIYYAPLHDWHRHHPTARRIARYLSADLLKLRSALIAKDVCECFHVSPRTAYQAISFARRGG